MSTPIVSTNGTIHLQSAVNNDFGFIVTIGQIVNIIDNLSGNII